MGRDDAPGVGVRVSCAACGPVEVDRYLVERYLDPTCGFGFATFLCPGCGELGTTRCPAAMGPLGDDVPGVATLRCTSPPRSPLRPGR